MATSKREQAIAQVNFWLGAEKGPSWLPADLFVEEYKPALAELKASFEALDDKAFSRAYGIGNFKRENGETVVNMIANRFAREDA